MLEVNLNPENANYLSILAASIQISSYSIWLARQISHI